MMKINSNNLHQVLQAIRDYAADKENDAERYVLAEHLSMAAYPKFKFSEFGRIFLEDEEFLSYYQSIMDPENWHSLDRKYVMSQTLNLVTNLPGDFVECGVYKGATALLLCRVAQGAGRSVHLFDSFEGLPEPGSNDGDYWKAGSFAAGSKPTEEILASFSCHRIYKGWIPDRFAEAGDEPVAFVHIDVDLFQPTWDSLEYFYPRLSPGGIVLFDDYGFLSCPGAKKAVDDFFADKPEQIVSLSTGQALVQKLF
ncbi:MAG: class I SAM-dependent methyltransferase [Rhizobiales bacterium]|nr:class I SAM-dependent methyltransferase [Hyphomicrobiales bacterium]